MLGSHIYYKQFKMLTNPLFPLRTGHHFKQSGDDHSYRNLHQK